MNALRDTNYRGKVSIMAIGNYAVFTTKMAHRGRVATDHSNQDLEYIAKLLETLNAKCQTDDSALNGEKSFIKAYKKLLSDYASALEASSLEQKAELEKTESAEREVAAEKRAVYEKTQETLKIASEAHLSDVRSGKIKPETIEDAKVLWQPSNGVQVVLSPPVKADSKTYIVRGKLVRMDGSNYIFEVYTGNDIKYFSCAIKNDSVQGKGTSLRFESEATIVGRLVDVASYTTVAGVTRMAPVFDALFIQN